MRPVATKKPTKTEVTAHELMLSIDATFTSYGLTGVKFEPAMTFSSGVLSTQKWAAYPVPKKKSVSPGIGNTRALALVALLHGLRSDAS